MELQHQNAKYKKKTLIQLKHENMKTHNYIINTKQMHTNNNK